MTRIIFLDIDGVLTNRKSGGFLFYCRSEDYVLNEYNLQCLNYILNNVKDCYIVLSTTWRNYPDNHIMIGCINGEVYKSLVPDLKMRLGDKIIGSAPHVIQRNKYGEIVEYLNSNGCDDFVVLDDDPTQGLEGFGKQFFKINQNDGLTLSVATEIIKYFE